MSVNRALLGLGVLLLAGCNGTAAETGPVGTEPPPNSTPVPLPTSPAPLIASFDCTPKSGNAPLKVLCSLQGAHTANKPISCVLDAGGIKRDLGDCRAPVTTELVLDQAGTWAVVLSVSDEAKLTVTATQQISVAPRPNQPPAINSFSATVLTGVPPFASTLTFAVSDLDGDVTTCSVDMGGDGNVEFPSIPCAQGSHPVTIAVMGVTAVVLKATDTFGGSSAKSLQLTGTPPTAEIRISKVEWGQSVVTETLRLVEGKPALLRVHVLGDKANLGAVKVDAEFRNGNGVVLGKVPLTGPASPPTAEQPGSLPQQWTGVVPAAWVVPGMEVRLKADAADSFAEADETNNLRTLKPAVGRGNVFMLTQVPVVSGGATGYTFNSEPVMQKLWPVKSVDQKPRAPYTYSGTISGYSSSGWGNLLQGLASARQSDGSNRNYYGYVKVSYQSGIAGIGYVGAEAATGRDDSPDTLAHELGHNMGRNHAPCGGASGADPAYPYAGAKIGSWGFDATTGQLKSPATYYDLMGYCPPEWVSDYNYKAVQNFLEAQPNIINAPPMSEKVLVAGVVRGGQVSFRPLQRLFAAAPEPQDGPTWVRLTAADGRTVRVSVALREVGDLDEQHFQALVEDLGALKSVELLDGTAVLAKVLARPAAAPRSELTRLDANTVRLTWDSARFPAASVAHFSDSGERTTLGFWLEGGEQRVRTDGLVGGHFEVGLSDGLNSARENVVVE